VDSGYYRQTAAALNQTGDKIALGSVRVNKVVSSVFDHGLKSGNCRKNISAVENHSRYSESLGLVGKFAPGKAHERCFDRFVKSRKQIVDVGLRAAGIAPADKMDYFHFIPPKGQIALVKISVLL
jgi:hypothetical protein